MCYLHLMTRPISKCFLFQKGTILDPSGSQASFWMQCNTLTRRSFVNMSRDLGYYWLRLVIYIIVAISVGSLYLNVGTSYNAILVRTIYLIHHILTME